mgnify:FL=1
MWYIESILKKSEKHIEEEVKKILKEAAETDKAEDKLYGKRNRGDELPDEMKDRRSRLKRLQECKERLEVRENELARKQQEKQDNNWSYLTYFICRLRFHCINYHTKIWNVDRLLIQWTSHCFVQQAHWYF